MSVGNVMDRLEVQLSEDILKNLLEPGKLFKQDITPKNDAESNPDTPKRPPASVLLEKMAGDVVKIYVTVYKADAGSAESPSEKPCDIKELENTAMQTDVKPMDASVTQTDKTAVEDNAIQTEKKEEKCQHQQTEKNVGESKHQQTEKNEGKSKHQQTDKKAEKHQLQQTVKTEFKEIHTQTDEKEFTNTDCQTVTTPIVEQDCQTDVAELITSLSQTDLSMATQVENMCQTDMSITTQVDGDCQTSVETRHMKCQTELLTSEQEIQATVTNKSTVCQATVTMRVKGSQTLVNNKAVLAQTDLSMLNPTDQECQVEVENFEQICQTDISQAFMEEFGVQASTENSEMCQQTDALPMMARFIQTDNLGVYAETQTVPDVNNRECQTEEVVISLPIDVIPEIENTSEIQENVLENVQEEIPMVAPEIEQPPEEIVQPSTSATANVSPPNVTEIGSQTDPVTIIIGDASFLVQKLKGASAQPAKVSGNEIEIEVGEGSDVTQNGGTPQGPYRPVKSHHSMSRPIYAPDVKPSVQNMSARKSTPKRQQVIGARQPYLKQERGSLSCPFCEMTFHESPHLYEHITNSHNEAATKRHKKPRGREGKTIVPRSQHVVQVNPPYLIPQPVPPKPVVVADHRMMPMVEGHEQIIEAQVQVSDSDGPPVLEPVYAFSEVPEPPQPSPAKKRRTYVRHQQQPVIEEPGLFEDLPNPARSYPRNRVRRDEMYEEEEEESVVVPQLDAYEYECPHCPEKYGSASHLYTHLKRSHKDDMEQNRPHAQEEDEDDEESEHVVKQNQVEETVEQAEPEYEEEEIEPEEQPNDDEEPCQEYVETEEEQHFMVQEPETSSPSPTPRKRKRVSTVAAVIKKQKREKHVVEEVEPEVEPELGQEAAEEEDIIESAETSQDEEGQMTEDTTEEPEESEVPLPVMQAPRRSKVSKVGDINEDITSSSKKTNNAKPRVTRKKTKANTPQQQQAEEVKPTRQSKRSKRT